MVNTDVVKHDFSDDEMGVGIDWAALMEPVSFLDDEEGLAARIALASVKLPEPKLVTKEELKTSPYRSVGKMPMALTTLYMRKWMGCNQAGFYNRGTFRLLPEIRLGKDL